MLRGAGLHNGLARGSDLLQGRGWLVGIEAGLDERRPVVIEVVPCPAPHGIAASVSPSIPIAVTAGRRSEKSAPSATMQAPTGTVLLLSSQS